MISVVETLGLVKRGFSVWSVKTLQRLVFLQSLQVRLCVRKCFAVRFQNACALDSRSVVLVKRLSLLCLVSFVCFARRVAFAFWRRFQVGTGFKFGS